MVYTLEINEVIVFSLTLVHEWRENFRRIWEQNMIHIKE